MTRWYLAPTLLASLLPACVDAPPADTMLVTPSSSRATSDLVVDASAISDGTRTTVTVELRARDDGSSIELVDGDQLMARIGHVVVGMPERLYTDVPRTTRARYQLAQDIGNPGTVMVELQRPDGSTPRITITVPPAFSVAAPLPTEMVRYEHVAFSVDPAPGEDRFGTATFDGTDLAPTGVYIDRFGQGSFVVGEGDGKLAAPTDTTLSLEVEADGTFDPAFGNTALEVPRGAQVRTAPVKLWP
jgi:hypothetical protein